MKAGLPRGGYAREAHTTQEKRSPGGASWKGARTSFYEGSESQNTQSRVMSYSSNGVNPRDREKREMAYVLNSLSGN